MEVKYFDLKFEPTPRFIAALKEVMNAEIEMMQQAESEYADTWHWGRCYIGDLGNMDGLLFEYGAEEDLPNDDLGQFGIKIEEQS